jgi:hypothetical protein
MLRTSASFALIIACFGLSTLAIVSAFGNHHYSDFGVFWHAGRHVLQGVNPYPAATFHALRNQDQFVYPAPAALLMAIFALLPLSISALVFLLLSLGAVALSLWLLDVRDLRCYALALVSLTMIQGVVMGTVTPLLMLVLAVAWRYRDQARWVAAVAAVAVGTKLFLAPLGIWLVATRRWRTAALATIASIATLVVCWFVIGIDSLRNYPALLSELTKVEGHSGLSTYALMAKLGLPDGRARLVTVALVLLLAVAAWVIADRPDGDRRAFTLAVVACLVISPIVWLNYYGLLIVPVALLSRRLSWWWVLPAATWLFPTANLPAPLWKLIAAHIFLGAIVVMALRGGGRDSSVSGPTDDALGVDVDVRRLRLTPATARASKAAGSTTLGSAAADTRPG